MLQKKLIYANICFSVKLIWKVRNICYQNKEFNLKIKNMETTIENRVKIQINIIRKY
jgi:hypothetical protein